MFSSTRDPGTVFLSDRLRPIEIETIPARGMPPFHFEELFRTDAIAAISTQTCGAFLTRISRYLPGTASIWQGRAFRFHAATILQLALSKRATSTHLANWVRRLLSAMPPVNFLLTCRLRPLVLKTFFAHRMPPRNLEKLSRTDALCAKSTGTRRTLRAAFVLNRSQCTGRSSRAFLLDAAAILHFALSKRTAWAALAHGIVRRIAAMTPVDFFFPDRLRPAVREAFLAHSMPPCHLEELRRAHALRSESTFTSRAFGTARVFNCAATGSAFLLNTGARLQLALGH